MTLKERFTAALERQTIRALARRNAALRPLLTNDALLDSVLVELKDAHAQEAKAHAATAGGNAAPFMDFLTWLMTNGPQLIAFITALISMFGSTADAQATLPLPA